MNQLCKDTIGQPTVNNLLGKTQQLLPFLFNQLVDLQLGDKVHILHPSVVELGPAVVGDEDKDEDE